MANDIRNFTIENKAQQIKGFRSDRTTVFDSVDGVCRKPLFVD